MSREKIDELLSPTNDNQGDGRCWLDGFATLICIAMAADGFRFENVENWRFDDGAKSLYHCFFVDDSERA